MRKQKILIAEDSSVDRDILCSVLSPDDSFGDKKGLNYTIINAKNGKEALEMAFNEKPDIILLDVIMPEMDGFEVIKELKASDETRQIPVIYITGLGQAEIEEKGFDLGAVDFISKPFRPKIVRARITTHLKIAEMLYKYEHIGYSDHLTGLPNRRYFDEQMFIEWSHAIRKKSVTSLLMIDLDHFKLINDTYGHPQGDVVLQEVAKSIKRVLKRSTDLVARWGGEEFSALLTGTNADNAAKIAEVVRAGVENTFIPNINNKDNSQIKVTASIGVFSIIPSANDSIIDFITNSDFALYDAKNNGRNRVCVFQS